MLSQFTRIRNVTQVLLVEQEVAGRMQPAPNLRVHSLHESELSNPNLRMRSHQSNVDKLTPWNPNSQTPNVGNRNAVCRARARELDTSLGCVNSDWQCWLTHDLKFVNRCNCPVGFRSTSSRNLDIVANFSLRRNL